MRQLGWALSALILGLLPTRGNSSAQVFPPDHTTFRSSDGVALHQLFGGPHLAANAARICENARHQSADSQFQLLLDWVLPSDKHPDIRLIGNFSVTGLSAYQAAIPNTIWSHTSDDTVLHQLLPREAIRSPVLQLIETAHTAGKLRGLRQQIESITPIDEEVFRSKLTLLFLVDVAAEDFASARASFGQFVEASQNTDRTQLENCWREFLVFWAGMHSPETRRMVGEYYFNLYRDPPETEFDSQTAVVRDWIRALQGTYQHLELHQAAVPPVDAADLESQWVPCSFSSSESIGTGKPLAQWETTDGKAFRITGHETDYLSYRLPLRGNFQVECDAYASSALSLALMVAGTYCQMTDSPHRVLVGNFGTPPHTVTVEPQLSKFREVIRLRATVHDGVLTHFINGRPVFRKELPPNHDPWVAIRTGDRSMGIIKDLRITGDSIVPEQIELIVNSELDGWAAYHAPNLADWQVRQTSSGGMELHSPRRPELARTSSEHLLYYHRPLVEDGTIEYDFFYAAGETVVYPALGRRAFILQPDGLSLHTITDGSYNRSDLIPNNETPVPKSQFESQPLPLIDNDWNRVALAVSGDELELFLNGQSIHKQALAFSNQRTFGLFHYQGRSQARIRNVIWRGDWPEAIPSVQNQKLASQELQFLEETAATLKDIFAHNFADNPALFDRFDVTGGQPAEFEQQPEGTHVTTRFGNTYRNSELSPRVRLSGDFDITAKFDRLTLHAEKGGSCGVFLQAAVENPTTQQFRVYRRLENVKERPGDCVKCIAIEQRGERPSYTTFELLVDETTSGSLRLARRGKKIYLLFAEGDSPNYRLLGTHETTTDDIHDIRLGSQSQNQSVTQVLWKHLTVRAERIESEEELLNNLNASREILPAEFEHNFGKAPLPPQLFELSGSLIPQADSLKMENLGTTRWSASRIRPLFGLQGDFDMEVLIDELVFPAAIVRRGTAFYFQIKYRNDSETRIELICGKDSEDRNMVYVQEQKIALRPDDRDWKSLLDRIILEDENSIESLRIVRRGKTIYFLYRPKGSPRDRLFARKEYSDQPILPGDIFLMLSSGKPDELSSLKLKSLRFRAETLFPDPKELRPEPDGN